jgi:hypothetical protein
MQRGELFHLMTLLIGDIIERRWWMNKFIVEDCWESEVPEENPVPAPLRQLQTPRALA